MRLNYSSFFAFLILVSIFATSCTDDSTNTVDSKVYVLSGHPDWSPIMFKSGDTIAGAGRDLIAKIFNDLGLKFTSKYVGSWDTVQLKAKDGSIDLIAAAYKNDERETYMYYSIPYTVDPVVIFVKKGKAFTFNSWSQLKGKKGLVTLGDSYGQDFDKFIKDSLTTSVENTPGDAFTKLSNDQADYFVYSLYAGRKAVLALSGQFESLPNYVTSEKFYITISKKSDLAKYLGEINILIDKYKTDGTIDNIIKKY